MRILSLEYHDIYRGNDPDTSGFPGPAPASYKLPIDSFVSHLVAIGRTRATVARAVDCVGSDRTAMAACITFDDGGRGAMDAADALEAHGWRGHFFVTTNWIGQRGFLDRGQIAELHGRGHIIGSHSMSHPKMMGMLAEDVVRGEWRESRSLLEDIVSAPVVTASVPGGFFKPHVGRAAAAEGIRILFNSGPTIRCSRIDGCWILGRYTIRRGTSPASAAALASRRILPRATQKLLYGGLTVVRAMAGPRYTRIRDKVWTLIGS